MASIQQCQERIDQHAAAAMAFYAAHTNNWFIDRNIRKAKVVSSTNARGKIDKNAELLLGLVGEIIKVSKDGKVHFTSPAMYHLELPRKLPRTLKVSPGCIELL